MRRHRSRLDGAGTMTAVPPEHVVAEVKLGWRVISIPPVRGPAQHLSRVFTIKSAAQQCLELARKKYPAATIETVYGDEGGAALNAATLR